MSIQAHSVESHESERNEYECSYGGCDEEFLEGNGIQKSFCSVNCYYRHKGRKALNKIESDHRYCATCFRPVKTTLAPSEDWIDRGSSALGTALDNGGELANIGGEITLDATECSQARPTATDSTVGYQYPTEHTEFVVDEVDSENPHRRVMRSGWGCQCGNIDLSERHEVLEDVEIGSILPLLWRCLVELAESGAVGPKDLSLNTELKERFLGGAREHWRDWEFIAGYALFGAEDHDEHD
jgi:hypothetical protein